MCFSRPLLLAGECKYRRSVTQTNGTTPQTASVYFHWSHQKLSFRFVSQHVNWDESKNTQISHPLQFPGSSQSRIFSGRLSGESAARRCTYSLRFPARSLEEGQCSPPHSGSFLPSPSGSHTFLVARGEPK